ncbi:MAG TPA: S-methyl-5'-thioadenosine phosphorylase [Anaerolineaceae bacterium]|jgi:5'-methylthioadenosine phosphorylase|nr:S-methyl-5'-thioadenosine phosphorylase [Anaerolineaceae bacterium]HPS32255.1 S-methyl-5'-thioadenosine phosphorylase [Anaerolineaceae bacterium]
MEAGKIAFGIIGGSGLYAFEGLENKKTVIIDTPFGLPSSPIVLGEVHGKPLAFLARHGIGHTISPSEVNYRANIYALKQLGVTKIISVSACGSLQEKFAPGDVVIPDQVFDFTHKRERSFFGEGLVVHVGTAEPFCPNLSAALAKALKAEGGTVHEGGAYITIEGPRFSTKAESNTFRAWGMSLVGMTASPEVFLAREAEICYATMAHVTDYDVWHTSEDPVSVDMVVRTLARNTDLAQRALIRLVDILEQSETDAPACACQDALKDALITSPGKIRPETREKLQLLISKYVK